MNKLNGIGWMPVFRVASLGGVSALAHWLLHFCGMAQNRQVLANSAQIPR